MSQVYTIDSTLARNNDFLLNSTVEVPVVYQGNMATPNRIISPCDSLKEQVRKVAEQNSRRLFTQSKNNMSLM